LKWLTVSTIYHDTKRTYQIVRKPNEGRTQTLNSLFGWLVADGWCWFVLREEYCWLVAGGWFVLREKYCWLVADKPSEQADGTWNVNSVLLYQTLSNRWDFNLRALHHSVV
jgi:hypothetical protein